MLKNITLPVAEIQHFCMHDGPGVRTTVFLGGCPLRCEWCHNPETQSTKQELLFDAGKCILCSACVSVCKSGVHSISDTHIIDRSSCSTCGECTKACPTKALTLSKRYMTLDEILADIKKDLPFYGKRGGVTLSGGEPLIHKEGVPELLSMCKACGISTAIETCGLFDPTILPEIVMNTDLFLWDVKDTAPERHKKHTGASNEAIIKNLCTADLLGARSRLRCILVRGVNTNEEHYRALADLFLSLSHCEGIELIPYHAYGGSKMLLLGKEDNGRTDRIPTSEDIAHAKAVIRACGGAVI